MKKKKKSKLPENRYENYPEYKTCWDKSHKMERMIMKLSLAAILLVTLINLIVVVF